MSTVFIAYSQKRVAETVELASTLTEYGYQVWYDVKLVPADSFAEVIAAQIDKAVAVITVWSPEAIKSQWVYHESRLALAQNKLVSVGTSDLNPLDLPLDFFGERIVKLENIDEILSRLLAMGVSPDESSSDEEIGLENLQKTAVRAWKAISDTRSELVVEAFRDEYNRLPLFRELAEKKLEELRSNGSAYLLEIDAENQESLELQEPKDDNPPGQSHWVKAFVEWLSDTRPTAIRISLAVATFLLAIGSVARLGALPPSDERRDTTAIAVALSDNNNALSAVATPDGGITVYRGSDRLGVVRGHGAPIVEAAFLDDGQSLLTLDASGEARTTSLTALPLRSAFDLREQIATLRRELWTPYGYPIAREVRGWPLNPAATAWPAAFSIAIVTLGLLFSLRLAEAGTKFFGQKSRQKARVFSASVSDNKPVKPRARQSVCITYFTFDDKFTSNGRADKLFEIVEELLLKQNISMDLFRGTEIAINYRSNLGTVEKYEGKAHYFLNLGTVKNETGFYNDVVKPRIMDLKSAWQPKETFDLTSEDIGAKSLGEASIEKLRQIAGQFVRRIISMET